MKACVCICATMLFAAIAGASCHGEGTYQPSWKRIEVEAAPGEFLQLERRDWTVDDRANTSDREKTALRIPSSGGIIEWEGREIPVVLRQEAGRLYMVGYDRETGRLNGDYVPRYSYFRQEGRSLVLTGRKNFPPELATQNMWLRDDRKLQAVLNLDTSDPWFRSSSNAFIWEDLMTGRCAHRSRVDKALLDDFKEKYKPMRLTTIKRDRGN